MNDACHKCDIENISFFFCSSSSSMSAKRTIAPESDDEDEEIQLHDASSEPVSTSDDKYDEEMIHGKKDTNNNKDDSDDDIEAGHNKNDDDDGEDNSEDESVKEIEIAKRKKRMKARKLRNQQKQVRIMMAEKGDDNEGNENHNNRYGYGDEKESERNSLQTTYGDSIETNSSFKNCTFWISVAFIGIIIVFFGYVFGYGSSIDSQRKPDSGFEKNSTHVDISNNPTIFTNGNTPTTTAQPTPLATTAPPTIALADKYSIEKLAKAKSKAKDVIAMLWKYYEPKSHNMLNRAFMFGFGDETKNDMTSESRPYNEENQKYITDRMARALVHKEKFIIAGIGSSVMAGHDNCGEDTYHKTIEYMMNPVFDETDTKLVIRNAGEGGACGDSHANQIFCFIQLAGEDIDILHFEWTYFGYEGIHVELLLRWLLMLPKAPAMLVFNTAGYMADHKLLPPTDQTDFNRAVLNVPGGDGIKLFNNAYKKYGFNAYLQERHISLNGVYEGKKWGKVGDGMHDTTRKGERVVNDPEEVKSQGVVFRNWHPGPLAFQALADALTYSYLRSFIDAIDSITEEVKNGRDPALKYPKKIPQNNLSLIPKPVHQLTGASISIPLNQRDPTPVPENGPLTLNQFLFHLLDMEDPPGCVSYERPLYGKKQIGFEELNSDFNPYKEEIQSNQYTGWTTMKSPLNNLIPRKDVNRPECQQLDGCGAIYSSNDKSGWLVMRLPKMEIGFVIICVGTGLGCNQDCFKNIKEHPEDYDIEFDKKSLNPSYFIPLGKKCYVVQPRFEGPVEDATGHLFFGFRAKKGCCSLTQVMAG